MCHDHERFGVCSQAVSPITFRAEKCHLRKRRQAPFLLIRGVLFLGEVLALEVLNCICSSYAVLTV